ncbi:MAG: Phosphoribosyl transferase domain, partial [Frankiaceae bacterium]|nr:Phosphoribosyl transferase domain [Frankiaceae bacterium]
GGSGPGIVTDDIVTTGSTLREAFRALDQAGWPVLGGAVVAATPERVTPLETAGEGV